MRKELDPERPWVSTDADGQIESLSSSAGELLGLAGVRARGQNLFMFFPASIRAMLLDAEIARTGWPNGRTAMLEPLSSRAVAVRYLVSAGFDAGTPRLTWVFDVDADGARLN